MRWKKELIGASLTLAVTVIAGVILWEITNEPTVEQREVLYFQLDKPVGFTGRAQSLSIGTLSFGNAGEMPAREVTATLTSQKAKILEVNAVRESGPGVTTSIRQEGSVATLIIANLLPGDRITGSYLLDSPGSVQLDVRSETSKAKPASSLKKSDAPGTKSQLNKLFERFWPILFLLSFVPLWIFRKERKQIKLREFYRPENRNNNAFVLMHTGHSEEARQLFKTSIDSGQDGSFAMSNYAGASALLGDDAEALKYIDAAAFLASAGHENAIVELNRAIIAFVKGDKDAAVKHIRAAVTISREELRHYLRHSIILKDICDWAPEIRSAIESRSGESVA